MENACEMRKRGDMPKTFVKSARKPVNMKLDKRTSFCTSLPTLSTVPGLGSPRAALRSENEEYASFIVAAIALSVRKGREEIRSDILYYNEVYDVDAGDSIETGSLIGDCQWRENGDQP